MDLKDTGDGVEEPPPVVRDEVVLHSDIAVGRVKIPIDEHRVRADLCEFAVAEKPE